MNTSIFLGSRTMRDAFNEWYLTKPNPAYTNPTPGQIWRDLNSQNSDGFYKRQDIKLAIELTNCFAWYMYSGDQFRALRISDESMIPDNQFFDINMKVYEFIYHFPFSIAQGSNPYERALYVMSMLSFTDSGVNRFEIGKRSNQMPHNAQHIDPSVFDEDYNLVDGMMSPESDDEDEDEQPGSQGGALSRIYMDDPQLVSKLLVASKKAMDKIPEFYRKALGIYGKDAFNKARQIPAILNLANLAMKLDKIDKMGTGKGVKYERDNDGTDVKTDRMTDISDVLKSNPADMMMPDFDRKIADESLNVRRKYSVKSKKQVLVILEDISGSMSQASKIMYCNAIALNRLNAVVKGEATLTYYPYETKLFKPTKITNESEAYDFWNDQIKRKRNMGVTAIHNCLEECIDKILQENGVNPDILLIHDGNDRVGEIDNKGVVIHSFILGQEHKKLREISDKSGGHYELVNV